MQINATGLDARGLNARRLRAKTLEDARQDARAPNALRLEVTR